jgi:NAD+ synthase (glutamine-hydrolysing)
MADRLRIALAQVDMPVGDLEGNAQRILDLSVRARDGLHADLIMFPEQTLCGYPAEDLLLNGAFPARVERALATVREGLSGIAALVGFPEYRGAEIHNSIALLDAGECLGVYRKRCLPNYGVFDEKRYFTPGTQDCVVSFHGARLGLTICEDAWLEGPVERTAGAGADLILNASASPYTTDKQAMRERVFGDRARATSVPGIYVNLVGGQDELVFDGQSLVVGADAEVLFRAPAFEDGLHLVEVLRDDAGWHPVPGSVTPVREQAEEVYVGLVRATRDYVDKNGFPGVVIGLSGGVDSALTLAIAADALGADRVRGVLMPSRYTLEMSIEDARAQAAALSVPVQEISIEPLFESALGQLAPAFSGLAPDTTEENLQARCRGMILMALSNKTGDMVLTTGNKSEMAVGYATLYGDMAGGFAPIRDCSKTLVYALARYRNRIGAVIPERVLTREPSAELRTGQQDSDVLPPYAVLDPILEALIEDRLPVSEVTALGFDAETVAWVARQVQRNEYKRRQAPPGVRISRLAFGRERRYPITSSYRDPVSGDPVVGSS